MGAFTKRDARLAPGVIVKSKSAYRSYCVTGYGPVQVYELLKSEFIHAHPDVLQDEYERACRRFARKAGL
jgi:hypothetical protein